MVAGRNARRVRGFGAVRRGRYVDRYAAIYVADADGSNLHLVTSHAYNEYGFAWSPDGRSILYGRANRQGIYVIGADGRNNHRLTRDSPLPRVSGPDLGPRRALDRLRHRPHRERRHLRDRRRRPQQGSTHKLSRERHRSLLATSIAGAQTRLDPGRRRQGGPLLGGFPCLTPGRPPRPRRHRWVGPAHGANPRLSPLTRNRQDRPVTPEVAGSSPLSHSCPRSTSGQNSPLAEGHLASHTTTVVLR